MAGGGGRGKEQDAFGVAPGVIDQVGDGAAHRFRTENSDERFRHVAVDGSAGTAGGEGDIFEECRNIGGGGLFAAFATREA